MAPCIGEKADKSKMQIMGLENDARWNMWGSNPQFILNDNLDQFGEWEPIPASFTIDLGVTLKLSRITHFHRSDYFHPLERGNPKLYEIYGYYGDGEPSNSGDWSEWTLILEHEEMLPVSGGSIGWTMADIDVVRVHGQMVEIPLSAEPIRYFRMKVLATWGNTTFAHITRLDFYGEILD